MSRLSVIGDNFSWAAGKPPEGMLSTLNIYPKKGVLLLVIFFFLQLIDGFQYGRGVRESSSFARLKSLRMIGSPFINAGNTNDLRSEKRRKIEALIESCKPNGLVATKQQRVNVDAAVRELEKLNPTSNPARSPKMNGFWRLLYTDFDPPATSAGKLGPFTGDVYQDLDSTAGQIINYLKIAFPKIEGGLVARQTIKDKSTWQIDFDRTGNYLFGFKFMKKVFKPGSQIRLWKITYLDDEWRIMRARRPETKEEDSFIFILQKDEKSRFDLNL